MVSVEHIAPAVELHQELIGRAETLAQDFRAIIKETEQARRIPMENMERLCDAGLLGVIQSKRNGGHELSMRAHLDVVAAVAEGCPATGWVLGVMQAHSWLMSHFPSKAQDEVYKKDPNTMISAVIGPRGKAVRQADGTYVLNGFWPFGSGCQNSDWLLLGAEVVDDADEVVDVADLLVPTSEVEIKDDWYVAGLQGTGSCSLVVKDLQVPAHRYLSLMSLINRDTPGMTDGTAGWIHYGEAVPVLALALCGGAIGLARAAVKDFRKNVVGRSVAYTEHMQAEWSATHILLATACAHADAGELLLFRCAEDIDSLARTREAMSMELRGRTRMDCAQGARFALDSADKLFSASGGAGLSLKCPMQQIARDLHAISMHGLITLEVNAEIYGRILLGLDAGTFLI